MKKKIKFKKQNISFRREFGLERFVPLSLIDGMKRKELRRLMAHFLKLNSQMTGSSKMLTQLQVHNFTLFFFLLLFSLLFLFYYWRNFIFGLIRYYEIRYIDAKGMDLEEHLFSFSIYSVHTHTTEYEHEQLILFWLIFH